MVRLKILPFALPLAAAEISDWSLEDASLMFFEAEESEFFGLSSKKSAKNSFASIVSFEAAGDGFSKESA